jgi:hypothetical protein
MKRLVVGTTVALVAWFQFPSQARKFKFELLDFVKTCKESSRIKFFWRFSLKDTFANFATATLNFSGANSLTNCLRYARLCYLLPSPK